MKQYWICTVMTVSNHGTGHLTFEVEAPCQATATKEGYLKTRELNFHDQEYDITEFAELVDVQPKGL